MIDQSNQAEPVTAPDARRIIRLAMAASMATIEPDGSPYLSLVTVATQVDCTPIILISQLSHHTANIRARPQVSLLFDGTSGLRDRLEGGRVSVSGTLAASTDQANQDRFMARHPDAFYAEFGDFNWFTISVTRAVFVAGFGRVRKFSKNRLLLASDQCADLTTAQKDLRATLNSQSGRTDSPPQEEPGTWQLAGIDPEGLDLLRHGEALRYDFPTTAATAQEALAQTSQLQAQAPAGDPILDLACNRTGLPPA